MGEIPSVVTCMSDLITLILLDFLGRHLPIVIGVLSVPLALAFDTDSYFYGKLPGDSGQRTGDPLLM